MKRILSPKILSALLLLLSINCFPQGVSINTTSTNADPSAMLDVSATDAGILT